MADNSEDLIISISTDQATLRRSIQRIERDLAGLSGTVQKQFTAVGKSIDNSISTTMQTRINAMVGIGTKASKEWTGALADQGKELERLRARYSPLFNTINGYKAAVADIKRAHAIGAISANEMTAAISRERQAALASTAAIKGRNAALADTPSSRGGGGSFNTANLAAQFQDIAVTSAMGMSPLQIALQQGTQISAVLGPMGAAGAVKSLSAAFLSVINPVSLATIGLVAAGAAAIQYFGSFDFGGKSEEVLKKEAELIQRIADKWGDVLPELKKYTDELNRVQENTDLREGLAIFNSIALSDVVSEITTTRESIAALVQDLRAAGDEDEVIINLQKAFEQFSESAADGKLEIEDVNRVQQALAAIVQGTGVPALEDFSAAFDRLAKAATVANDKVKSATGSASRAIPERAWRSFDPATGGMRDSSGNPWGGADGPIQGSGFNTPESGPTPRSRPNIELEGLPGQETASKKAETAAQKAANAYRDLLKTASDRIGQVQQEIELLGKYGIEADAARFSLDLFQAAEDKGRSLSAAQRKEIEQKVELYKQYSTVLSKAKLQQDLLMDLRFNSLSEQDKQITTTLRQYGLSEDLGSAEAGKIRQSLQTEELRGDLKNFASDFRSELLNNGGDIGAAFADSIGNALCGRERSYDFGGFFK
uniref:phage tail length tape measure family protein n=1 Tax=uncultured Rhizobium sp. TaxID=155567 RepID=UPI002629EAA6|nr:phage tail length tape measure family protein [uncultured Rhizobium sp.]